VPLLHHSPWGSAPGGFDSLRRVIKTWKFYLDPLRLVLPMSKAKCVTNDLKRDFPLWIFLCKEVLDMKMQADFCVSLPFLCGVLLLAPS
jgi:hypothetical protein